MVLISLCNAAGTLSYYFCTRERQTGIANLDIVFGNAKTSREKKIILKKSFASFALTMLDLFWFSRHTEKRIAQYQTFIPSVGPYFENRAQIIITAHAGNWELIGLESGLRNLNITSVAATTKNKIVGNHLTQLRQLTGQNIIAKEGALRALIHRFRNNGKAAFVLDQNTSPDRGGIWVDFLGIRTPVSPAPAHLAYRTGTEIIFAFSQPIEGGKYEAHTGSIITPPPFDKTKNQAEVVHQLTQQILDVISQHILSHPESWLWSYKHWRHIAPGDAPSNYPVYR